MTRQENPLPAGGPPAKTVVALACFALFGGIALLAWHLWFDPGDGEWSEGGGEEPAAAGPTPGGGIARGLDAKEPSPRLSGRGEVIIPRQAIEDPGGRAMRAFHDALAELERGSRRVVRVLHYGDSILTTDQLSGTVRRLLQERFGDGGHGFILLGKPWRWYKHLDVEHGASGKWRERPITSDPLADGIYGLGGVAMEPQRASHGKAWVRTAPEGRFGRKAASFDISYLEQPRGGSFDLRIAGEEERVVSTAAGAVAVAHLELKTRPGPGGVEVQYNNDGPVRLLGVAMESGDPGIVYDSLAINGARASVLARYDEEHWRGELRRREPALVVLMFGANEGANRFLVLKEYRVHLTNVLRTLREAVPYASVLVVGPLDQAKREDDGRLDSWRMPRKLSEAQREVALAEGCAFFDTWTAMGGRGSMAHWYSHGMGGGDLIHPTEKGAQRIGTWLAEALLYGYYSKAEQLGEGPGDAGVQDGSPRP